MDDFLLSIFPLTVCKRAHFNEKPTFEPSGPRPNLRKFVLGCCERAVISRTAGFPAAYGWDCPVGRALEMRNVTLIPLGRLRTSVSI